MLHAINTVRARLGLVVMVWVPAHSGVSPNAYADAAAKAHLTAAAVPGAATAMVMAELPAGRTVPVVSTDTGMELWPETQFSAVREAMGWWVRRAEAEGRRATVDAAHIGPRWAPRALAVRSTLYGRISAAADRVRAMPAARRRTRLRVLCRPR